MRFMEDIEVIINKAQPTTIDHVGIAMAKFKEYLEEYFKTTENNDDRKYNYHHAIAYQEILEQYGVDKAEISQITESIRE